ncbi:MAG: hypothetical protein A3F31_01315 [Candidatus Levybacteria bacterium RIFCSPHIGHO2_12_FULL_38_12]|nr:MAG: hypothetical protein A2770_01995 [Candidatus Levybacteria bacterium RIFCSPHIGHO2_01_FULL_38_12]OGH23301.1 MAG: hypothetical protein A3F31_01315 [Candidatus Levybacteria bacterium RIFCSPHIGHO2_12_FULL_38_12]OGH34444.1 MAG: hypothetical protein A3A47_00235 [Candidatus Levybacteria bacterium RIFCSPLOWO2_01_FULL_37_20]OGH44258.1 MAG: hypothetical protein A3J14_01755 [Candidatus Levybacteria bacterium RIFCSPLOWO2_02_FULL_37_18]
MELSKERLYRVEQLLVETVIKALEQGGIKEIDLPPVSSYILDHVQIIKTEEELMKFLRELSSKWSIFTPVLVLESGEVQKKMESEVISGILELAKDNKIDEAVSLAKSAT